MLVFFALLLGVLDFGQIMFSHQSLAERVRQAVRWGSVRPYEGPAPIRNMVLYGQPSSPRRATPGFLGLKPENVVVSHRDRSPDRPDDETLTITIVDFESQLFAPWVARKLVSPRPVSFTAPMSRRAGPTDAAAVNGP